MKRIWRNNFLRRLPWREALREFRRRVFPEKRHLSYGSSSLQLLCYGGCGHGWNATWISMGETAAAVRVQHPQIFMGYTKQQVDLQVPMGSNGSKLCQVGSQSLIFMAPQKMMVSLKDTPRPGRLAGVKTSCITASRSTRSSADGNDGTCSALLAQIPSGNLLHSYWKWPSRNSGFSQL